MQGLMEKNSWKKDLSLFDQKLQFTYPSLQNVQATWEAFILQKRTFST